MFVVTISKGVPNSSPNVAIQYQSDDTVVKQSSTDATSTQICEEGLENNQTSVITSQNILSKTQIPGQNKFVSLLSDMNVPISDINIENNPRNMQSAVGKVHVGYPDVSVTTVVPNSMQEQSTGETDFHSEFQTVPNTSNLGEQYTNTALKKVVLIQQFVPSIVSAPDEVNQELQDAVANISESAGKVEHVGAMVNVNNEEQLQARSDRMNMDKHIQIFHSLPLEGCQQYHGINSNKSQSQESMSKPHIPSQSSGVKKFTVEELKAIGTTEKDILSDFFERTRMRKRKPKPLTQNKMKYASAESANDSVKEEINSVNDRLELSNNDGEKDHNDKLTSYKSDDETVCHTDAGNLEIKTRSGSVKRKNLNDDNSALTYLESRKCTKNHHDMKKADKIDNDGENQFLAGESHTNKSSSNVPVSVYDSDQIDPNVDAEMNAYVAEDDSVAELNYWSDICKCIHYADKCVVKIAPILQKIIKNRKCEIEIEIEDSLQVSPLQKKESDCGVTSYCVVVTNPPSYVQIPSPINTCEKSPTLTYNTRGKGKRKVKRPAKFDQNSKQFVTKDDSKKKTAEDIGKEIKMEEQSKNEIIANVKDTTCSRLRSSKLSGHTLNQFAAKSVSKMEAKGNGSEERGKNFKNKNTSVTTMSGCSTKLDHKLKQSVSKKVPMKTKTRKSRQTKTNKLRIKLNMTGKGKKKSQTTNVENSFDEDSKLNSETDYIEPFDTNMQVSEDEMDDSNCVKESTKSSEKDNSSCIVSSEDVDKEVHEEENLFMNKVTECTDETKQATISKKSKGTKKTEKPKCYIVKTDEQGVRMFECPLCGYTSRYSQNAVKHIVEHTAQKDFVCDQCAATFNSSNKLARHMVVHQTDRPFTCPLCPNTFKSKKTFHCDLCDHVTKYGNHIKTHINRHTGHRPYQCETCGLSFTGLSNLKLHSRQHNDTMFYDCQLCNKGFKDRGNYKQHMRRHVGYKQHVCEHCGKSFVISSDLKKHLRTHTGEKPYKCNVCERDFRDSSSMIRHKNSHSQKHRYECGFCQKTFSRHDLCKSHMNKKHKDVEHPISINKVTNSSLSRNESAEKHIGMTDHQKSEIGVANEQKPQYNIATQQNTLIDVANQQKAQINVANQQKPQMHMANQQNSLRNMSNQHRSQIQQNPPMNMANQQNSLINMANQQNPPINMANPQNSQIVMANQQNLPNESELKIKQEIQSPLKKQLQKFKGVQEEERPNLQGTSYEAPLQNYDGFDCRAAPNQSAYYQNVNPSMDGYGNVNRPIYPGQLQYVVVQDDRGEVEWEGNLVIENA